MSLSFMTLKNVNLAWASTIHPSPARRYPFVILVLNDNRHRANWDALYRALGWVERRLLIVGNKETLEAILKNRPVENQRPVLDYIQELSPSQG